MSQRTEESVDSAKTALSFPRQKRNTNHEKTESNYVETKRNFYAKGNGSKAEGFTNAGCYSGLEKRRKF